MKIYPAEYLAHIEGECQTLALCWLIEKRNGQTVRGTGLDVDIDLVSTEGTDDLLTGTYYAAAGIRGSDTRVKSDLSVDNMQVEGSVDDGLDIDISVADIESGVLANAAVTLFLVNYQDPDTYQDIRQRGYLGEISRTAEGVYRTEIRGLTQRLQQAIGATYGERCDVKRFGDARCSLNVEALAITGEITAVTSRRRFDTALDLGVLTPAAGYFETGEISFTTGANAGFLKQVKFDSVGAVMGHFNLWDQLPNDPQVGDAFTVKPGCDRTYARCTFWENTLNFRGHGLWIPGLPKIIRAP